jgi:hypothetical protein
LTAQPAAFEFPLGLDRLPPPRRPLHVFRPGCADLLQEYEAKINGVFFEVLI